MGGPGWGSSGSGSGQVASCGEYSNEVSSCSKRGQLIDRSVTTSLMTKSMLY
jgi:hypothetical protein